MPKPAIITGRAPSRASFHFQLPTSEMPGPIGHLVKCGETSSAASIILIVRTCPYAPLTSSESTMARSTTPSMSVTRLRRVERFPHDGLPIDVRGLGDAAVRCLTKHQADTRPLRLTSGLHRLQGHFLHVLEVTSDRRADPPNARSVETTAESTGPGSTELLMGSPRTRVRCVSALGREDRAVGRRWQ